MTPEELAAIKAACEKATPGPWIYRDHFHLDNSDLCDSDAIFIENAREWVPDLVAEVERLQAEIERIKEIIRKEREAESQRWAQISTHVEEWAGERQMKAREAMDALDRVLEQIDGAG